LVGTSIDESTRTVKVHGHLHKDENNTFAIGMFVDAEIEVISKQAFALPEDAVIEADGETFILILEAQENNGYMFEQVEVKIGKKYNGFVEVISETITPTDKILTKGAFSLVGGEEGGGHSH